MKFLQLGSGGKSISIYKFAGWGWATLRVGKGLPRLVGATGVGLFE